MILSAFSMSRITRFRILAITVYFNPSSTSMLWFNENGHPLCANVSETLPPL